MVNFSLDGILEECQAEQSMKFLNFSKLNPEI